MERVMVVAASVVVLMAGGASAQAVESVDVACAAHGHWNCAY